MAGTVSQVLTAPEENEEDRLEQLFWNRAALKKQHAELRYENHELKDKLKQFKSAVEDRKRERDPEAQTLIDKFLTAYLSKSMHPKDQTSVRKALGDCLLSARVKRDPEHRNVFTGAAIALLGGSGSLST